MHVWVHRSGENLEAVLLTSTGGHEWKGLQTHLAFLIAGHSQFKTVWQQLPTNHKGALDDESHWLLQWNFPFLIPVLYTMSCQHNLSFIPWKRRNSGFLDQLPTWMLISSEVTVEIKRNAVVRLEPLLHWPTIPSNRLVSLKNAETVMFLVSCFSGQCTFPFWTIENP